MIAIFRNFPQDRRMSDNTESVEAVLFTDWEEGRKHGPGAIIWTGDVGRLSLLMILPGQDDFRALQVQQGPPPESHVWGWDGNQDRPTLTPSIDALKLGPKGERIGSLWHGYLTAGRFVSC